MSTDYSKMSDFEINKRVAISVGFPCYYGDGSYTNNLGLIGAIVKGKSTSGLFMVGEFNPCNNPADAWPIIVANKISIASLDNKWIAAPIDTVIYGITGDSDVCFYASSDAVFDANPLRAAMIVFLMMQESKNAS